MRRRASGGCERQKLGHPKLSPASRCPGQNCSRGSGFLAPRTYSKKPASGKPVRVAPRAGRRVARSASTRRDVVASTEGRTTGPAGVWSESHPGPRWAATTDAVRRTEKDSERRREEPRQRLPGSAAPTAGARPERGEAYGQGERKKERVVGPRVSGRERQAGREQGGDQERSVGDSRREVEGRAAAEAAGRAHDDDGEHDRRNDAHERRE